MSDLIHRRLLGLPWWFYPALLAVALWGARLRIACADHDYIYQWDESLHALVARNLIDQPFTPVLLRNYPEAIPEDGYIRTSVWLHKPPLSLWMMAASIALFGDDELSLRIPSILADTLLILFLGFLIARLSSSLIGFGVSMLWAMCPAASALVGGTRATDHPDVWLCFFSTLCWLLFACGWSGRRKRLAIFLFGLCLGAAVLAKGLCGLLIAIAVAACGLFAWVCLLIRNGWRWRDSRIFNGLRMAGWIAPGAMICLPWMIYTRIRFPIQSAAESRNALAHIYEVLDGHAGGPLYHFEWLMNGLFGWNGTAAAWTGLALVAAAIAWGLAGGTPLRRLAAAWLIVVFGVYTIAATKMKFYCLPAWPPFLFLACDAAVAVLNGRLMRRSPRALLVSAYLALLALAAWPLHHQARNCIQRAQSPRTKESLSAFYRYDDLKWAMLGLAKDPRPAIVWNALDNLFIQASYYSNKTVMAIRPTRALIEQSRERGLANYVLVVKGTADRRVLKEELGNMDPGLRFIEVEPAT